jgi:hypothetical protein
MAQCKFCGKQAGIFQDEHRWCYQAHIAGISLEEQYAKDAARAATPLQAVGVFWAVFGALWAFSLTAGLVYFLLRASSM